MRQKSIFLASYLMGNLTFGLEKIDSWSINSFGCLAFLFLGKKVICFLMVICLSVTFASFVRKDERHTSTLTWGKKSVLKDVLEQWFSTGGLRSASWASNQRRSKTQTYMNCLRLASSPFSHLKVCLDIFKTSVVCWAKKGWETLS